MAILQVARLGDPAVRAGGRPVPRDALRLDGFRRLIEDMVETLRAYQGVGLAAPQVRVPLRILVYEVARSARYPGRAPLPLTAVVNPRLKRIGRGVKEDWEGCLSIPDLRGRVPRWSRVELTGLTPQGKPIRIRAQGFPARILQHEVDHLDGKVYLDRMHDLESLTFLSEFNRFHAPPDRRVPA